MARWDLEEVDMSPLMRLRRKCGFSRERAGVVLGCSLSAMIRYERGRTPVPFITQKKMMRLYRVSAAEMYDILAETYRGAEGYDPYELVEVDMVTGTITGGGFDAH